MSNYLIIAAVSWAIKTLLEQAASVVNNTTVTTGIPKETNGANINLFLYQVSHNPHLMNVNTFAHSADDSLLKQRPLALDLNYLITFYGEESELEPHRLVGSVISHLNNKPILTIDDIWNANNGKPNIARADLEKYFKDIRLTECPLTIEELYQIWALLGKIPYALSIVYQASPVLIDVSDNFREKKKIVK